MSRTSSWRCEIIRTVTDKPIPDAVNPHFICRALRITDACGCINKIKRRGCDCDMLIVIALQIIIENKVEFAIHP